MDNSSTKEFASDKINPHHQTSSNDLCLANFQLSSDCKLFLSNPISSSSELFVKIFDSNSTDITIRCNIQLNVVDSFYYNKAVLMDIFGTKSSIANFINSFQSMVPDMVGFFFLP